MTAVDVWPWIKEALTELPECQNIFLSPDECQSWFDEIRTELTAVLNPPTNEKIAKKIISLYLQFKATKHRYDSLDRIAVVVPWDLKETRVYIHDWEGNDRANPRAVIMRHDPDFAGISYIPVEEIDILRSIQKNPSVIRHFAVQIAIHRWAELVRYYYNLPAVAGKTKAKRRKHIQDGQETETEYERGVRKRSFWYNIASEHLKRIGGQVILEQAEKDAIESEFALAIHIIRPLQDQLHYLQTVWELLRSGLKDMSNPSERMKKLREQLEAQRDKYPPVYRNKPESDEDAEIDENDSKVVNLAKMLEAERRKEIRVPLVELARPVLTFLEGDTGKPFQQSPGQWRSIQSHFISWYLGRGRRRTQVILKKLSESPPAGFHSPDSYEALRLAHPNLWNDYFLSHFVDWSSPYDWFSPLALTPDRQ